MRSHLKKNWLWYLIIILLAGTNLYLYAGKKWSERQARIRLEEAGIECNDRIATITEQNHLEEIKRQGSFYASLVNQNVFEKNWDEVRNTLQNIVRETMITEVNFVQTDKDIKVSTNSEKEGDPIDKNLPENLFSADAVIHAQKTDRGYLLSVPVYHENAYLGRLLMLHSLLTSNVTPGK